jgi:membrane-associated phospholipid phosphatase
VNAGRDSAPRAFALAALRLSALFVLVFYGADEWAARSATHWRLYAGWELAIPYWPPAFAVYVTVFAVPFLVLWRVRDAAQVRRWELEMAVALVVGGAIFVMLPAELGYAPADAGAWQGPAELVRTIAGRHNLLPSLHVAFTVVTLRAIWPWADRRQRAGLLGWFVLLLASVLLTHQHHLADLVAGALLGWAVGWGRSRQAARGQRCRSAQAR